MKFLIVSLILLVSTFIANASQSIVNSENFADLSISADTAAQDSISSDVAPTSDINDCASYLINSRNSGVLPTLLNGQSQKTRSKKLFFGSDMCFVDYISAEIGVVIFSLFAFSLFAVSANNSYCKILGDLTSQKSVSASRIPQVLLI